MNKRPGVLHNAIYVKHERMKKGIGSQARQIIAIFPKIYYNSLILVMLGVRS